jgi:LytS/YehU family sensor histidine kinase
MLYVVDKDVREANRFIAQFSRLIRQTLEISTHSEIPLQTEIDYISTYLELETKRFENRFVYKVLVQEGIDLQECFIPPMILQPYIENAVVHGIDHRKDGEGRVEVRMEWKNERLVCVIEDNGVGRKQAALRKAGSAHQSFGMALTARRIETLNATGKASIFVELEDLQGPEGDPAGTRVTVYFPHQGLSE